MKGSKKDKLYAAFKASQPHLKLPEDWRKLGTGAMRIYTGWLKKRIAKIEAGRKKKGHL